MLAQITCCPLRADDIIFAYNGDTLPTDPQSGWAPSVYVCDEVCADYVSYGHYVIDWPNPPEDVGYGRWLASSPDGVPPTLWAEWHFKSNHPKPPNFYGTDGSFTIQYVNVLEKVHMYGDAAISFSGGDFVLGLDLNEWHSYRFECLDGAHYTVSVDGEVFISDFEGVPHSGRGITFFGHGAASSEGVVNVRNEWDFVRYGAITFGERIVESDPPTGFIDPGSPQNLALDRITVTYDSPAYAYIDDIAVGVTCDAGPPCAQAPQVIATKRLDNGPPDVLEIVFDRPLPPGERTTFTFTDVDPSDPANPTMNTVAYTFQRGDVNADGQWNLLDFASLQNCYFTLATSNACAAFDYDTSIFVDAADYAPFAIDFVDHGP